MLPIILREERLPVARRPTVVDVEDDIAVIHERLRQCGVHDHRLAAWPAVYHHERRLQVLMRDPPLMRRQPTTGGQDFDRYIAPQPRIAGSVDFSRAPSTHGSEDFIRRRGGRRAQETYLEVSAEIIQRMELAISWQRTDAAHGPGSCGLRRCRLARIKKVRQERVGASIECSGRARHRRPALGPFLRAFPRPPVSTNGRSLLQGKIGLNPLDLFGFLPLDFGRSLTQGPAGLLVGVHAHPELSSPD